MSFGAQHSPRGSIFVAALQPNSKRSSQGDDGQSLGSLSRVSRNNKQNTRQHRTHSIEHHTKKKLPQSREQPSMRVCSADSQKSINAQRVQQVSLADRIKENMIQQLQTIKFSPRRQQIANESRILMHQSSPKPSTAEPSEQQRISQTPQINQNNQKTKSNCCQLF